MDGNPGDKRDQVALTPYLPWTSGRLGEMLGIGAEVAGWERPDVAGGTELGMVTTLFTKLDADALELPETDILTDD